MKSGLFRTLFGVSRWGHIYRGRREGGRKKSFCLLLSLVLSFSLSPAREVSRKPLQSLPKDPQSSPKPPRRLPKSSPSGRLGSPKPPEGSPKPPQSTPDYPQTTPGYPGLPTRAPPKGTTQRVKKKPVSSPHKIGKIQDAIRVRFRHFLQMSIVNCISISGGQT